MNVAAHPYISLFAGSGALDLAIKIALPEARCVCYVEAEITALAVLAARITEGTLDDAPVWSDVATFNGIPWSKKVEGIIGGFPCQDLSLAGKRAGIHGARSGLWGHFARIIREVRPQWVYIENVPGLRQNHAMRRVLGDLSKIGYDAEWISLRASEVGASHQRDRVFILAHPSRSGLPGRQCQPGNPQQECPPPERAGAVVVHPDRRVPVEGGRPTSGEAPGGRPHAGPARPGPILADAGDRQFPEPGWNPEIQDGAGSAIPLFPPGPAKVEAWDQLLVWRPWLRPAISRAEVESHLRGLADGLTKMVVHHRTISLCLEGNGVVPIQAAAAFTLLAARLGSASGEPGVNTKEQQ